MNGWKFHEPGKLFTWYFLELHKTKQTWKAAHRCCRRTVRVASLQPLRHTLASHGKAAASTQTRVGRQSPGAQHVDLSASLRRHCRPGLYKPSPWLQADERPGGLWSLTTCKINRPKGVPLHGRAAGGWAGNTRQASKFPGRSSKSPFISNAIFPEIFSK